MQKIDLLLHLASGQEARTSIEVTDDFDEREIEGLIHGTLTATDRGSWQQLGDLFCHTAAVQAVEII